MGLLSTYKKSKRAKRLRYLIDQYLEANHRYCTLEALLKDFTGTRIGSVEDVKDVAPTPIAEDEVRYCLDSGNERDGSSRTQIVGLDDKVYVLDLSEEEHLTHIFQHLKAQLSHVSVIKILARYAEVDAVSHVGILASDAPFLENHERLIDHLLTLTPEDLNLTGSIPVTAAAAAATNSEAPTANAITSAENDTSGPMMDTVANNLRTMISVLTQLAGGDSDGSDDGSGLTLFDTDEGSDSDCDSDCDSDSDEDE